MIAANEQQVLDWLGTQGDAMQALLADLVNIDSGSTNKAGVDKVGEAIAAFLRRHGIACEVTPNDRFGHALRGYVGTPGERNILLMGHRDTVFPDGEAQRRPFKRENGRGYGPGVTDMKAGLVMNSFVAAAMNRFKSAPAPVVVLYTSDEEIGSPSSRAIIEAEARRARLVLNAEPGRPGNAVVTGRKGGVFMRFKVTGQAAHAGANFDQGRSAIAEIAHKIVALNALTDLSKGVTVNVGIVKGGQTVNTVAPLAEGEVEFRYVARADRDETLAKIEAIMAHATVPGTAGALDVYAEFLPLEQTEAGQRLFDFYAACGAALGHTVTGIHTGGCSDAGFTSAAGAPTLCATGPIGGRAHSPDEFVELDSMVPRAQVLALTVMRGGDFS